MCPLRPGRRHVLHGLERVKRLEDLREDLGQIHHLHKERPAPLDLLPPLQVVLVAVGLGEIIGSEGLHDPVGAENMGRPSVDERPPFVLHIESPGESLPQTLFPRWDLPMRAVEVEAEFLGRGHQLGGGRPLITLGSL